MDGTDVPDSPNLQSSDEGTFAVVDAGRGAGAGLSVEGADAATSSEVRSSEAVSSEAISSEAGSGWGIGGLLGRFLLIYPLVFMLPFPFTLTGTLNAIPGFTELGLGPVLSMPAVVHAGLTHGLVMPLGLLFTGEVPSFESTGSGDGVASYLGALVDLILAASYATLWWVVSRRAPIPPRVADACRVLLRYALASVMLSYGFSKLFPLQFPEMGPARALQPFGDASPMGLLWTFMGASPGYQMFGGAAEVLGGLLLLFRRTTLLGSLVVAAVMTNVFAMNLFFDVPVKLHSFHYLLFAILLTLPDAPRLFGVFVANLPVAARDLRPFWHGWPFSRRTAGIIKLALIALMLSSNIESRVERMHTRGLWAPPSDLTGFYRVESFRMPSDASPDSPTDSSSDISPSSPSLNLSPESPSNSGEGLALEAPVPDELRWVRVGIDWPYGVAVVRADGTTTRYRMRLDEEASTVTLFDRGTLEPGDDVEPLRLERLEGESIRLSGVFDGEFLDMTLRVDEAESLFHSRGFRWINEVPFNR